MLFRVLIPPGLIHLHFDVTFRIFIESIALVRNIQLDLLLLVDKDVNIAIAIREILLLFKLLSI